MDDVEAIREANAAFYRAMAGGDLPAMESVWHHGEGVSCVHPGWDRLDGWAAVHRSWGRIFGGQGKVPVEARNVTVSIAGMAAWVSCDEILERQDGLSVQRVRLTATNVFVRTDDGWRMVVHHVSPAPRVEPQLN